MLNFKISFFTQKNDVIERKWKINVKEGRTLYSQIAFNVPTLRGRNLLACFGARKPLGFVI